MMQAKKDFYTYTEAQAAAQALGIKSKPDYKKRYREGLRLPSCPGEVYADAGWIDWYEFLGNERPEFYPTYWYDACQANQPDTQHSIRKQASANQQLSAGKLDGLLTDYAAVNHYVQGCLKLINEGEQSVEGENGVRLISGGDLAEVGVAFEESKTNYHLLAEICQNATIYRSANPSRAVPLIAQAIDRMAESNGLAPAMYRLDDKQKLVVANEMNRILLQRLGSWEKIDDLFSGDLKPP